MIILLASLGAGILCFFAVYAFFGVIGAILPAFVVFLALFFWLSRMVGRRLEGTMLHIQQDLQKGRLDEAIKALLLLQKKYGKMQFFLTASLDGQIGSIYYLRQDFKAAKPYLERAFVRHWIAKAMLAVIYYRKKDYDKMNETFEQATKYSSKQGLLWCLWAYCVWRLGDITRAIEILSRGNDKLKNADERLQANLLSLQNSKRMKMRGYGEQWYQFHLEVPPEQNKLRQGRVRFASR